MTRINRQKASMILREEARKADNNESMSKEWVDKVEELSRRCTEGNAATHIAFLGTTLLAKSVEEEIDLCAIKPKHYPDNKLAYSARSLCHNVLVPLSAELGINIAVTGREPLNNQPYFRMSYLKDGTPVHQKSKSAFDYMVALVDEISNMSKTSARKALSAYIYVRKQYQPNYLAHDKEAVATPEELLSSIVEFVNENSEGGRRAQAVVAGLMDAFTGQERVESGRINDPSRKHPGDVCIVSDNDEYAWEKAFEVRDKPVSKQDILIFGKKCIDLRVREAALVMVSERQSSIDEDEISKWANKFGIGITLFHGWEDLVNQALFWCKDPKPIAAKKSIGLIHDRLIEVEVDEASIVLWGKLISDI